MTYWNPVRGLFQQRCPGVYRTARYGSVAVLWLVASSLTRSLSRSTKTAILTGYFSLASHHGRGKGIIVSLLISNKEGNKNKEGNAVAVSRSTQVVSLQLGQQYQLLQHPQFSCVFFLLLGLCFHRIRLISLPYYHLCLVF